MEVWKQNLNETAWQCIRPRRKVCWADEMRSDRQRQQIGENNRKRGVSLCALWRTQAVDSFRHELSPPPLAEREPLSAIHLLSSPWRTLTTLSQEPFTKHKLHWYLTKTFSLFSLITRLSVNLECSFFSRDVLPLNGNWWWWFWRKLHFMFT